MHDDARIIGGCARLSRLRTRPIPVALRATVAALLVLLLASCTASRQLETGGEPAPAELSEDRSESAGERATRDSRETQPPSARPREEIIERGSGSFIGAGRNVPRDAGGTEEGDINLRFEGTDIQEFIKVVLGDLLGVDYTIDTGVTGTVTVHTSEPITVDQLLPLFEEVLSINNAALVRAGRLYHVVPRGTARQREGAPSVIGGNVPGYRTQIIPLRFISAREMQQILERVVPDPNAVRIDPVRNLVIASGAAAEVQTVQDTIAIFDVDWLRGMSMGIYPLDHVDPRTLESELRQVLAATAGDAENRVLGGLVRFVPLERLTSLLVVSSTPAALREAEIWVRRLDQPGESAGQRLYVYALQNAKASDLADILGNVFRSRSGGSATSSGPGADGLAARGGLAPGLTPVEIAPEGGRTAGTSMAVPRSEARQTGSSSAVDGLALTGSGPIEIIADDVRNALVILASAQDYRMVESAVRRLDVVPLQVLIEAKILEVTLRDDLSYGVEWFFRNAVDDGAKTGFGMLDLGSPGIGALAPGFSYTVVDNVDQVRLALNLLAAESEVNVLSSPSLMVLDNQEATINVGDEIPVPSRQSISNIDPVAPTVNEIVFRQTGVTLSVTPRVNNSGLVTMDIRQEVATAAPTSTSNIDAPTIQNRYISSVVAINSGDTIVLGGLMQEQKASGQSGVPFLYRIPVLGKAFGRTVNERSRTELLVLITPRVVRQSEDARAITDEFRRKLRQIEAFEAEVTGDSVL